MVCWLFCLLLFIFDIFGYLVSCDSFYLDLVGLWVKFVNVFQGVATMSFITFFVCHNIDRFGWIGVKFVELSLLVVCQGIISLDCKYILIIVPIVMHHEFICDFFPWESFLNWFIICSPLFVLHGLLIKLNFAWMY